MTNARITGVCHDHKGTKAKVVSDHKDTVSIGGRTITNLCFAEDINGLAGEEEEPTKLVECLNRASTAYGMMIIA